MEEHCQLFEYNTQMSFSKCNFNFSFNFSYQIFFCYYYYNVISQVNWFLLVHNIICII